MPKLTDYLRLAPFSVEELVDAANSLLRDRPSLAVSRRTVRYYVGVRILPPPGGPPKHARYGPEHLIRLVAARALGDVGRSLEAIRTELEGFPPVADAAASRVQALLDPVVAPKPSAPAPQFPRTFEGEAPPFERAFASETVRRVRLGRFVVEAPADLDLESLLDELRREIDTIAEH